MRGEWQIASSNLLGSEQFSGGGLQSVRGYEQGEVIGDNALFFSQELILPPMPVSTQLLRSETAGLLTPYLFHDYARLWNVHKLPGEKAFNLHSIGLNIRYQVARHGSLQVAHGWQLRDSGSNNSRNRNRLHIAANLSF